MNNLDAVYVARKYSCSLDDAIDTLECLKRTNEVKKILLAIDKNDIYGGGKGRIIGGYIEESKVPFPPIP